MGRKTSVNREKARALVASGLSRTEVAEQLNITYSAVYRLTADQEVLSSRTTAKGDEVRAAFLEGSSLVEISKKFDISYQLAHYLCLRSPAAKLETSDEP